MVQCETFVMTTDSARDVIVTCLTGRSRVQAIAELLLLTSDLRPVSTEMLVVFGESLSKCRDSVVSMTKQLLVLVNDVSSQLHSVSSKWEGISQSLNEIINLVISITECCSHAAYLTCTTMPDCRPSKPATIDKYIVSRSHIDITYCCSQIRHSSVKQLSPKILISLCSDISKNLSILTNSLRKAGENLTDSASEEQMRLCVKSMTSCASCMLASIKCFRLDPSDILHRRCIGFSDALMASTGALVNFATEHQFIGKPAFFTPEAKILQNSILGSSMGVVSSTVQLCKTIQTLASDSANIRHRSRTNLCLESVTKSTNQLAETLVSCHFGDKEPLLEAKSTSDTGYVKHDKKTRSKDVSSNHDSGHWELGSSDL